MKSVTVLGCGAVGLFYGTRLKRGGAEVKFLLRSDYETVKINGVTVHSINGDYHETVTACRQSEECSGSDLILVSLKTTARSYLKEVLPKVYGPSSMVMTLQNGLGNEELISTMVPKNRIIGAVAFVCLNRTEPGVISHTAFGHIKANAYDPSMNENYVTEIKNLFIQAGIDFQIAPSLGLLKWEKLIWNVPFNGLSAALGGVDTLSILNHPPSYRIVEKLMEEVISIAGANGMVLSPQLIRENIDKTLRMGAYRTSMCLDRLNLKSIEAESIVGEPLRQGANKGLSLPYMESLYSALSFYNTFVASTDTAGVNKLKRDTTGIHF
ncbi:MAG: 2-dehydropantoate 2-reductase [Candidatus Aureabacteria bacterium]|nr:2-dehydropantoate 2-reductase [Candidatus Auribacterota bacterium]